MAKLDKKKIESALKSLATAGKNAVAALNDMTDGEFRESPLEKEPLDNLNFVVNALKKGLQQADESAAYEGLTDDEVALAKEAQRATELEALQAGVLEKIAKRKPAPVEPEPEDELVDQEANPDATPPTE